jgi:hypothetical protein
MFKKTKLFLSVFVVMSCEDQVFSMEDFSSEDFSFTPSRSTFGRGRGGHSFRGRGFISQRYTPRGDDFEQEERPSFRGRGRGRGGFRGGHKESPEEYRERKERANAAKFEKTKAYAESLGITVYSFMDEAAIQREIDDKKRERKREYEERKREREEAELERLRDEGSRLGVSMASYKSASELRREIGEAKSRKQLEENRAYAERLGISGASWMSSSDLSDAIDKVKRERREENKALKAMLQREREDDLILRAANRKPGERVSYKERLEERHAFTSRGMFDGGLCRTSDDTAYDYMRSTMTRSYDDVVREARARRK